MLVCYLFTYLFVYLFFTVIRLEHPLIFLFSKFIAVDSVAVSVFCQFCCNQTCDGSLIIVTPHTWLISCCRRYLHAN